MTLAQQLQSLLQAKSTGSRSTTNAPMIVAEENNAPQRRLWLGRITWTLHEARLQYGIDDRVFETVVQYGPEVNLVALEARYGTDYLTGIFFHMLAFEANKVLSFGPRTFDPGPHAHRITPAFLRLWRTIGHRVWAQWRYQHDWPDYQGPSLCIADPIDGCSLPLPIKLDQTNNKILSFCGGGKDSLVSMKLFEQSAIPYATLVYAHSAYGALTHQHDLADQLLDTCQPKVRHKQSVSDTFFEESTESLCATYQVKHLLAAETPSSIFNALPLVLSQQYRQISLGHERSADTGNLIWSRTGEDVNHQWGKSFEAQKLINDYIQQELITNFSYFSLLKPVYDVLIFAMLRHDLESAVFTHSCNLAKPWCKRCPKCAYVWLNYMAYLPADTVHAIFGDDNLLDYDENQLAYRQMLGLEAHTPFECIGQVPEARLAFELIKGKGVRGRAMDIYNAEVPPQDWEQILLRFGRVVTEHNFLPAEVAQKTLPLMKNVEVVTCAQLRQVLLKS